ncbi:uncharacterized protein HaLaN_16362 [Haematococcus lacustris]|uniref:AGC-kinase C-terminal domain-containing protein n=1 Tax=Haematococcus lacustris TaxID=44745 RepID=A0A699Z9T3_HAELA|nr:uncharacterized protein HaLaN_16362 [Haematococcus lacustris]
MTSPVQSGAAAGCTSSSLGRRGCQQQHHGRDRCTRGRRVSRRRTASTQTQPDDAELWKCLGPCVVAANELNWRFLAWVLLQDLISRLLERKPVRRLGCLQARARDVKAHPWFKGFDWDALSSRRMPPPRRPKDEDSSKRKSELETSYKADERCPAVTPEEKAEWERVFRDF